jgi:hypothetical protein
MKSCGRADELVILKEGDMMATERFQEARLIKMLVDAG